EISRSATSGGVFDRGPRYLRSITAPPAFRLARRVRRVLTRWAGRWGARRRGFTSSRERTKRLISAFAAAVSAAALRAESLGGRDLRRRHLREILGLQHLAVGHGEARVDLDFWRFALGFGEAREQCLLDTLGAGRRLLVFPRWRLREHGREQLVEHATPAKEDAERLLEDERMLVPLHQYRMQRPIEIVARADARRLDRRERVHHRSRTDRNAGRAQGAGEVDDVFGKTAANPLSLSAGVLRAADMIRGQDRSRGVGRKSMHNFRRAFTPPRGAPRAPRR